MKLPASRRDQAFREGLTWSQFLDTMKVNRSQIEENYRGFSLNQSDKEFLNTLPGVTDVLVLAHDWCGDVVANLPLFARIEAETGKFRLHILLKDPDNTDVGLLYPHPDGDVHIPVYVFFNAEGKELGHFIERTDALSGRMGQWIAQFWQQNPHLKGAGESFSALDPEVRGALLGHLGSERQKVRDFEKQSIFELLKTIG